ncbi:hypothetical protein AB3X96_30625 [Paraburkholderia sp. BR13439]|uniref:hypothetical protein n=1 Tax=Paraburkholderia sp. BR13439 TaxID=3236996 RepID=UPI0034CDC92E
MLELLVKRSDTVAEAKHKDALKDRHATVATAATGKVIDRVGDVLWLSQTQPVDINQVKVALPNGCDQLLLDKLRAQDQKRSEQLMCIKISVPKAAVVGRTVDGIATYKGPFTSYLKVPS